MHAWKILMAVIVLLVLIMILSALPPINKPRTGSSQEVTMDINEIHKFMSMNQNLTVILTVIETVMGVFTTLFLLFIAWRVLTVFEKLSTTFDRLLQQKIADNQEQDRDTE